MAGIRSNLRLAAHDGADARLPPMGNTFLNWVFTPEGEDMEPTCARLRARSCPGYYVSHRMEESEAAGASKAGREPGAGRPTPAALELLKLEEKNGEEQTWGSSTSTRHSDTDSLGDEFEDSDSTARWEAVAEARARLRMSPKRWAATRINGATGASASPTARMSSSGYMRKEQEPAVTTMMLKNLPLLITQMALAAELDNSGFQGEYDFLYMPTAFGTGKGQGYAFINCRSPCIAERLRLAWGGKSHFVEGFHTVSTVVPAHIQGLEANVAKWDKAKMRRVRNPNHRPLVLAAVRGPVDTASRARHGC